MRGASTTRMMNRTRRNTFLSPTLILFLLLTSSTKAQSPTPSPPTATIPPSTDSAAGSAQTTDSSSSESSINNNFNYFFLLLAALGAVLFGSLLYYLNRRRLRIRDSAQQSRGRIALARDIEAWGRAGVRYGGSRAHPLDTAGRVVRREEGTDERGEAPPSYEVASKDRPPSLRVIEREASAGGGVELREIREGRAGPPEYDHRASRGRGEGWEDVELADVRRPEAARVVGDQANSNPNPNENSRWKAFTRRFTQGGASGWSVELGRM